MVQKVIGSEVPNWLVKKDIAAGAYMLGLWGSDIGLQTVNVRAAMNAHEVNTWVAIECPKGYTKAQEGRVAIHNVAGS